MRNKILTNLFKSEFMEELLNTITGGHSLKEELRQELFLILCEMNEEKIIEAYENKYLNYLCINILKKQYHSSTSPFHKKYRKNKFEELEDRYKSPEEDKSREELILKKIKWFLDNKVDITDRELFKLYYKMDRYDRFLGDLKDETCDKPISSTRKIERKLSLESAVPGKKRVSIDHSTISISLIRTRNKIKEYLKKEKLL